MDVADSRPGADERWKNLCGGQEMKRSAQNDGDERNRWGESEWHRGNGYLRKESRRLTLRKCGRVRGQLRQREKGGQK